MSDVYWNKTKASMITIKIVYDPLDRDDRTYRSETTMFIGPGQGIDLSILPLTKKKPQDKR